MKKLTTNSKLIGCLMGLSIVALGTGCTDSDYDLSSVDSTIGVGGEGLHAAEPERRSTQGEAEQPRHGRG